MLCFQAVLYIFYSITNPSERRLLHINVVSYKILEKHKPIVPDDLITGTSDVIKSNLFCQSVWIEMFYKCNKFQVISICGSEIKGCRHFVPPPAYKGPKSPGLIGLRYVNILQCLRRRKTFHLPLHRSEPRWSVRCTITMARFVALGSCQRTISTTMLH